jgi:phosphate:Na+ symporter
MGNGGYQGASALVKKHRFVLHKKGTAFVMHRFLGYVLFMALLLLAAGCGTSVENEADKIIVRSGDKQVAKLGAECSKAVVVEVLGPQRRGVLGGSGGRHPVPGVTVRFQAKDESTGLTVTGPVEMQTDSGGYARTTVRLGQAFGDQYLDAYVVEDPSISVTLRFVAGIEKGGDKQETVAGRTLSRPLTITVTDQQGKPVEAVPVYFTLVSGPGKQAKLTTEWEKTDAQGIARTNLETDPEVTGKYEVMAEIADPVKGRAVRGVVFTVLSLNRVSLIVGVLGGLGVFIFGMKLMSDGLRQAAGNNLRSILHFFTNNRVIAVFAGTVVTGLIQSSSACTVMVVGFVNAGLLSLEQAIGVVFGANIGTTVTAQMISFNLKEMALPAITLGVAVTMIARRSKIRSIAQSVLGFGLLFMGMEMMSSQLKGISSFPSFIKVFQSFDCQPSPGGLMPLWAVLGALLIGTLMTVLVQSSSATIGLAIALATSGLISFWTAVPLILGDNIGTTVTALLASIGTNRPARQSAVAHTIFNVLGALYMIILLYVTVNGVPVFMYLVDMFTAGDVFAEVPENIGRHIAAAHTLFNVFNVLLFLPLIPLIAVVCRFIVPGQKGETAVSEVLEPHLLDTPPIAYEQSLAGMVKMVSNATDLAFDCIDTLEEKKVKDAEGLRSRENAIDQAQHDIIHYLTALTQRSLTEEISRAIPLLVHCVNDAERIGDHAMNILELSERLNDGKIDFSGKAKNELAEIVQLIRSQSKAVLAAFETYGEDEAARALKLEGEINHMTAAAERNHVRRLEKGKCSVAGGIAYTEILANIERIGDRLANIAERAPELVNPHAE